MTPKRLTWMAAVMFMSIGSAYGELKHWTGADGTNWFTAANWAPPGPPQTGDTAVVVEGTAVWLTNATPPLAGFVLGGGRTLTVSGWTSAIVASEIALTGTVTHAVNTVTSTNSLGEWVPQHRVLIQGSNLTIAAAGRINTDTLGYRGGGAGPGCGPGGGVYDPYSFDYGGGASYGGLGGHGYYGAACGLPYGAPDWPWQPGSGGANKGGPGGGAVWIELNGGLHVDGEIRANGGTGVSGNYGGGSGGAIVIACRTFAGSGWLRANGASGNSNGGGGGGGRIALHFNGPLQAQSAVSVPRFQATGSTVAKWHHSESIKDYANGSVYLSDIGFFAKIWPVWEGWLHAPTNRLDVMGDLTLSACNAAFATVRTMTVGGNLTLGSAGKLYLVGETTATPTLPGAQLDVAGSILIQSGGALYPRSHPTNGASVRIRAANLTVESGGTINATGRGFRGGSNRLADDPDGPIADGYGPGAGKKGFAGTTVYGGGGSYGGLGGDGYRGFRGLRYGVADQVCQPGSGGAGAIAGYGGGLIWMECDDHVRIDGNLLADGDPYAASFVYEGGGSGGGVSIRCRTLDGCGRIQANGGSGSNNGGVGGGGRIALHFDPAAQRAIDPPALFCELNSGASGVIRRSSPIDWRMGTLYLADPVLLGNDWSNWAGWLHVATNHLQHTGDLIVNAGWAAVANPQRLTVTGDFQINGPGKFMIAPEPTAANHIPGAELVVGGALEVGDGATLMMHSHATNGAPLKITAANVTVAKGGLICGDERGYFGREAPWPAYGIGAGLDYSTTHGSGAGHGGAGGYSYSAKPGGIAYGLRLAPLAPGSGGGGLNFGGHGGAAIWIVTPGVLRIDGEIRSNGGALREDFNGGGSGGGILLAARRIVGGTNGMIRADGANGNYYGGAGAGGRIACWLGISEAYSNKLISGEVTEQTMAPKPAAFEGETRVLGGTGYTFYTGPNEYYNKAGDGSVAWLSVHGTVLMVR